MQDPNPLPWGALDRFQAQFIVRKNAGSSGVNYTAKTSLSTKGHFGSKVITKVEWTGYGDLATKLNSDSELNDPESDPEDPSSSASLPSAASAS